MPTNKKVSNKSESKINNKYIYHDGNDQDWLYKKIVLEKRKDYKNLIEERPTWPIIYHLSEQRKHLLIPFDISGDILEIGGGCGALSGFLAEKSTTFTTIEWSKERSEIIKQRIKNYQEKSLVITGTIDKLPKNKKFDNIIIVGAWEYSGKVYNSEDPYNDFIKNLIIHLKPNGKIYIAIENKFGLKYFSGCKEDHYSRYYEGIEGYPMYSGVKTFSKIEIVSYLTKNGLNEYIFYYPFPDYKLPFEMHSDWSIRHMDLSSNGTFPTTDLGNDREYFFSEGLAFRNLTESGVQDFFSNSFLVIASKAKIKPNVNVLYSRTDFNKLENKRVITEITSQNNKYKVIKRFGNSYDRNDGQLTLTKNKLSKEFFFPKNLDKKDIKEIEYIKGKTMESMLLDLLIEKNIESFNNEINGLYKKVIKCNGEISSSYFDMNFGNLVVNKNKIYIVDLEILKNDSIPTKLIFIRAMVDFYRHNYLNIFSIYKEINDINDFFSLICKELVFINKVDIDKYSSEERLIQKNVYKKQIKIENFVNLYPKREQFMDINLKIKDYHYLIENYQNDLSSKEKDLSNKQLEIHNLTNKIIDLEDYLNNVLSENKALKSYLENSRALELSRSAKKLFKFNKENEKNEK